MAPLGVLLWLLIVAICNAQPSEYIITYDGLTNDELATKCQLLNCSRIFSNVIQGIVVTKDPLAASSLSVDDPSIQDMTPNSKVSLYVADATGEDLADIKVPYHLDRLDQLTLPLDGKWNPMNDCNDVIMYILDTGVYANHTEFLGADSRIRVKPGFAAGSIPGDGTTDCSGHGTFVASLAAGKTVGVCKEATIIPVAVLNCVGDGPISQIVEGLEWIVAHAGNTTNTNGSSVIISKYTMGYPGMSPEVFQNANIALLACQLFTMLVSLAVSVALATRRPRAAPLTVSQKL
jgi:subtilisin family serine protease